MWEGGMERVCIRAGEGWRWCCATRAGELFFVRRRRGYTVLLLLLLIGSQLFSRSFKVCLIFFWQGACRNGGLLAAWLHEMRVWGCFCCWRRFIAALSWVMLIGIRFHCEIYMRVAVCVCIRIFRDCCIGARRVSYYWRAASKPRFGMTLIIFWEWVVHGGLKSWGEIYWVCI